MFAGEDQRQQEDSRRNTGWDVRRRTAGETPHGMSGRRGATTTGGQQENTGGDVRRTSISS
ncbi:hypothetical protein [uncultured Duncaniella sp.]|uniref:hypothetical protein n=1 Tax=uncultured Duncaniella sp. TaxID=2768039 RepID=UPI00260F00D9|nr:hypothetical protein [uncultured Duncaniella sp.]